MTSNHAIPPEIAQEISRRLAEAEREHKVRILYCCESGSRAWGFASPDSDYDVRFIYVHEEDWYLSFDIERRRDVIEYSIVDEIDCSGWDLRKALYLFTRTNGALLEWLNSPIHYIERGNFAAKLRDLAPRAINNVALCYHYSHMARRNAREYLFRDKVKLKKYFYVLRPLLAIRYIEEGRGIPPVEFEHLVESVAPSDIRQGIASLLAAKRVTPELGLGDPIPEINTFISTETERHGTAFHGQGRPDINERVEVAEELNALFRETIKGEHKGSHPTERY
ncbi:MAG: nucleotidyltransferase domain-containing protein [Candidatus Electrothrix sp. GW3-4]|uniref:nucleotidyltransferase domain-containing protein n=1 Tax=Candidatus Electrothrix sp. GW3-4 TaxID=3126740 RepID=UPI0030CAE81D